MLGRITQGRAISFFCQRSVKPAHRVSYLSAKGIQAVAKGLQLGGQFSLFAKSSGNKSSSKLSANQLNEQIHRGQAPQGITEVHKPKVSHEQLHVHFSDGSALNLDGSWKHGGLPLTRKQGE